MLIKNTRAIDRILSILLALIIILSSLSSCIALRKPAGSREEIEANVTQSTANRTYAYQYLSLWGVPAFDNAKFFYFENIVTSCYNYSELPAVREHAKMTVNYFLEYYYSKIDLSNKTAVTDALLTCYVAVLGDRYSLYREPVETENYQADMSGKFGGIGVMVEYDHDNEQISVSSVLIGSPAEAAGIKAGDLICLVDGKSVEEIGYLNVVSHVRGEIGTSVDLTVMRDGKYITFNIIRSEIDDTNVYYEIDDETGFGYVQIISFKSNTYAQFTKAIDELENAGVKGVIFDLRGNPGGYVSSVCNVISYIMPTGYTVVTYQQRGKSITERKTQPDGFTDHVLDLPMVIICDENTASASEIFTSAIRDYRNSNLINATIVGTTTFKKGILQTEYSYIDGSTVTLTTAFYCPPSGVNYHGVGITPDVYVELPQAELDEETGKYLPVEDTQLNAAIEELEKLVNAN